MGSWEPVDLIVGLLTVVIFIFVALIGWRVSRKDAQVDEKHADILKQILITILTIISLYVGSEIEM